jgi:hypothetical protein
VSRAKQTQFRALRRVAWCSGKVSAQGGAGRREEWCNAQCRAERSKGHYVEQGSGKGRAVIRAEQSAG